MKYYEIILTGRVQGVGFRYYTYQLAQKLGVTGYVKNLSNGDVKIIAGSSHEQRTEKFLQEVTSGPSFAKITNSTIEKLDNRREYNSFDIKY